MAPYKLTLAYDGTLFYGMQKQVEERTVQSELENGLRQIGWNEKSILFAGRTDRGVHASGQVVSIDLNWAHSLEKLRDAINANVGNDLAIQKVEEVRAGFHPRYDAIRRNYQYRMYCSSYPDPLRERFAWRVWPDLKLEALGRTSQELIGEKDFAAFGTPPKEGGSTVRKIFKALWAREKEDEIIFEVSANGFLYHMVRRLVGYLVKTSRELDDQLEINQVLEQKKLIQELAPAKGLTLMSVDY